jgi:hypothetical protein
MLNTNTNLFGFLLSQVGWSGDTATGRRRVTNQGWIPKNATIVIKSVIKTGGNGTVSDVYSISKLF